MAILIAPAFAIIFKQQAATSPHALQREQLQLAAIVCLRIDVADTLAQRQACSGANQQRQFFQRRIKPPANHWWLSKSYQPS